MLTITLNMNDPSELIKSQTFQNGVTQDPTKYFCEKLTPEILIVVLTVKE